MQIVEFEGIFHNVGQGLFYSGEIVHHNDSFNFVYDCGSIWNNNKPNLKYLEAAIQRYITNLNNKDILHLLVISHLHSDHVNGLPILLDKFKRVKYVVLPYFSPLERLIIALYNLNAPYWYFEFLADPATFLLNRNVEIVVFITENEGKDDFPFREGPDKPFDFPIEKLPNGKPLEKKDYPEKFWEKIYYKLPGSVELYYSNSNFNCISHPIWEFIFFNYKGEIKVEHLEKFRACLNDFIENKSLTSAIRNKEFLRKIKRKCYSKLVEQGNLKDFNNTSLVLFHRPINFLSGKMNFLQIPKDILDYYRYLLFPLWRKLGTLLLGDIDLNQTLYELINFFKYRLKEVSFALIPHHGSKRNWNNDILKIIECPTFWVASAGTYNRFGHPSCKIFREISKRKCIPVWCSEINPVIYHFELEYECN